MNLDLSDEAIEKKANELRQRLGMETVPALNIRHILNLLPHKMKRFSVRTSLPDEIECDEAFMDCETGTMVLGADVAYELNTGNLRARFTVAHELGHYLLGHEGNTKRSPKKSSYLTYQQKIQEIQADLFASYLLAPTQIARNCASPEDIREQFKISLPAAKIAFDRIQSVRRKERGEQRPPVATVVSFLREAEKHGYPVKSNISGFVAEKPLVHLVAMPTAQVSPPETSPAEQHAKAVMQGYTGNVCRECLNFTLVRDGNCERCNTCGATSGCS